MKARRKGQKRTREAVRLRCTAMAIARAVKRNAIVACACAPYFVPSPPPQRRGQARNRNAVHAMWSIVMCVLVAPTVRAMLVMGVHVCVALVVGVVLRRRVQWHTPKSHPMLLAVVMLVLVLELVYSVAVAGAVTSGAWWGHCVARRRQHHAVACFRFVCVLCSYSRRCTCT